MWVAGTSCPGWWLVSVSPYLLVEDVAERLRGSLLGLRALSPLTLFLLLSLIPKAKPSSDPTAPSRNPVASWFAGIPLVGGAFSQVNRAGDWLDSELGLTTSKESGRATAPPLSGAQRAALGTTVILNVDGEKLAEATVKSQGQRNIIANGVLQARSAAAARG